jgi:lipopolysaccharide/colanic/teichoic acid biosynthesis glycosyltransferase
VRKVYISDSNTTTISVFKKVLKEDSFIIYDSLSMQGSLLDNVKSLNPDLVILNAERNGIDILINDAGTKNIPVLFLFEKNKYEQIYSPSFSNIHGYSKPFNRKKLIDVVEKAISHSKTLNENIPFNLKEKIISHAGEDVYNYLSNYAELNHPCTNVVSTTSTFNLKIFQNQQIQKLVNLKKINDIRHINKFLEVSNEVLPPGGLFMGCAETMGQRKARILKKFPPVLNYLYYTADFILKRVFPKLPLTKKIYFFLTGGRNRVLSRPEVLGRLYSCGFELLDDQFINNKYYFVAKKIRDPYFDPHPSYGLIVKMRRIGKDGKLINVYKFRTMHPYSEYIQDYLYKKNNLSNTGKFQNDFRITSIGRFLRKFWLDEIPMILNLFKGDIKLFGVRPISEQYLSLYPEDFKEIRSQYKPGLFPPYYADMPESLVDIVLSEKKYLEEYSKHPFKTDLKYFIKVIKNILLRKARSS